MMRAKVLVSKKKRKRVDQTNNLMRGVVKAMRSGMANRATREIDLQYGKNVIVQIRKRIKYAKTYLEKCMYVAVALMLGYRVFVRRSKVMVEEKEEKHQHQLLAQATSNRTNNGGGITDLERAFMFYCMWRLRKEDNPSFEYLNKDATLMICYFIVKKDVDQIMDQI